MGSRVLGCAGLLLFAGCEVVRPPGSYEPVDAAGDVADAAGDAGRSRPGFAEDEDASELASDSNVAIARPDAGGVRPRPDAGAADARAPARDSGSEGSNSGAAPPASPLAALEGNYLMRMDQFATTEASMAGITLRLRTRMSELLIARVSLAGERLMSAETLCHQTYTHDCQEGCVDGWTTKTDKALPAWFPHATLAREYRVEDGQLSAERGVMALGFDHDGVVDVETELPQLPSDERLWRYGSASEPARIGVSAWHQASLVGGLFTLDCVVATVQLLSTTFAGALGTGDSALEQAFALNSEGSGGLPIYAEGEPASYCTTAQLGGAPVPAEIAEEVRFVRFGDGESCPALAEFERELPATAP